MNEIFDQSCCVSGKDCNAPAGFKTKNGDAYICDYEVGEMKNKGARLTCFACGDAVCENCSSVYDYYNFGKKIICDNCANEHDLIKPAVSNFVNRLTRLM